ncbi:MULTISPECIES: ABC transporter substrate-binding protein [unclassified Pseudofrankia]|uniref:ABC transporter substrate-binding protein n=1 Tax=unclassified Pseudofrankia TaxID=2994372 RepID=UPI0008D9DC0B|nr:MULTISPECIES: ABC transporter substrate-binding protein [unclassified Pseudofrankia]MDT3438498.1 ABC transporter substrate-binding protein [Pseudofrankia sp. BMG5.37]OHV49713.1 ABC transporter substrate-binding protein [Pseudofrankia sp. BMG5.36]
MRRSDRSTGKKRPIFQAAGGNDAAARPQLASSPTTAADTDHGLAAPAATGREEPAAASGQGFRFVDRRALLRLAGTAALAAPAGGLLAACSGSGSSTSSKIRPVRIGLVTPQSGALSSFADADLFVTDVLKDFFANNGGLSVGSTTHPVEIYIRDSQSTFARAAKAASQLISDDQVDIVLVGSTSDTVNPVADQCEVNSVPCISTMAPWESRYVDPSGNLKTSNWTYHFFPGLAEYFNAYSSMWGQTAEVPNNHTVGALWPDDTDGRTFANPKLRFRQGLAATNLELASAGTPVGFSDYLLYTPGTKSFVDIIAQFQEQNVQIVTGIARAADYIQFQRDAINQKFFPRIITLSKGLLFESDLKVLGGTVADGLTTEMFWSNKRQTRSFLTNWTSAQLADQYQKASGPSGSQQLGTSLALFDVAAQALAKVNSLDDRKAIADVLKTLTARTIVGDVKFGARKDLPQNVATIPLNGGQWRWHADTFTFDLEQVNNSGDGNIPNTGTLRQLNQDA